MAARIYVGPSGYSYPEWRGSYYPADLPQRRWLAHISREFPAIELNGTFYSLKSPAAFERWAAEVPDEGFVFAIKGSRFITHTRRLAAVEGALANFYASGVLALGKKTGPFLWQLPASLTFDAGRVAGFLEQLPRSAAEAERLARRHDEHLPSLALTVAAARGAYRHALEVRHPSYAVPAFFDLLARHRVSSVIADTAGRYPVLDRVTSDLVYVRLHGSEELYASRYTDDELARWADRIDAWAATDGIREIHVYFDNTALAHAPCDARRLLALLAARKTGR